eukprot:Nk52_evm15s240 gene=Nk52_evmTU15s240
MSSSAGRSAELSVEPIGEDNMSDDANGNDQCDLEEPKAKRVAVKGCKDLLVALIDGRILKFNTTAKTSVKDVVKMVVERLQLPSYLFFGLSLCGDSPGEENAVAEEHFLDNDKKIWKFAPANESHVVSLLWGHSRKVNETSDTTSSFVSEGHGTSSFKLKFRYRYFPVSVREIRTDEGYHLLYLQLKEAVVDDRIYLNDATKAKILASYCLQAEFGDFDECSNQYGVEISTLLPHDFMERGVELNDGKPFVEGELANDISALHARHRGLPQKEAETRYINTVQGLDDYGKEYYKFKDKKDRDMWLGLGIDGVGIYSGAYKSKKLEKMFPWLDKVKVSFAGRRFICETTDDSAFVTTASLMSPSMSFNKYVMNACKDYVRIQSMLRTVAERADQSPESVPVLSSSNDTPARDPVQRYSSRVADYYRALYQNLEAGFADGEIEQEYAELFEADISRQLDGSAGANKCKNRYRNVLPYDDTRVKLISCRDGSSDYINASWMQYKDDSEDLLYIAGQGPLPSTVADFWQVVVEQEVKMIVMVTQEKERERVVKCHRYWPADLGQSLDFEDFSVTFVSSGQHQDFCVRHFDIVFDKTNVVRRVTHLQYLAWPDFGVPASYRSVLNFVKEVRVMSDIHSDAPLLVHCSSGVGRTGAFMVLDVALKKMLNMEDVFVFDIAQCFRQQRPGIIDSVDQYVFIHKALQEEILSLKFEERATSPTNIPLSRAPQPAREPSKSAEQTGESECTNSEKEASSSAATEIPLAPSPITRRKTFNGRRARPSIATPLRRTGSGELSRRIETTTSLQDLAVASPQLEKKEKSRPSFFKRVKTFLRRKPTKKYKIVNSPHPKDVEAPSSPSDSGYAGSPTMIVTQKRDDEVGDEENAETQGRNSIADVGSNEDVCIQDDGGSRECKSLIPDFDECKEIKFDESTDLNPPKEENDADGFATQADGVTNLSTVVEESCVESSVNNTTSAVTGNDQNGEYAEVAEYEDVLTNSLGSLAPTATLKENPEIVSRNEDIDAKAPEKCSGGIVPQTVGGIVPQTVGSLSWMEDSGDFDELKIVNIKCDSPSVTENTPNGNGASESQIGSGEVEASGFAAMYEQAKIKDCADKKEESDQVSENKFESEDKYYGAPVSHSADGSEDEEEGLYDSFKVKDPDSVEEVTVEESVVEKFSEEECVPVCEDKRTYAEPHEEKYSDNETAVGTVEFIDSGNECENEDSDKDSFSSALENSEAEREDILYGFSSQKVSSTNQDSFAIFDDEENTTKLDISESSIENSSPVKKRDAVVTNFEPEEQKEDGFELEKNEAEVELQQAEVSSVPQEMVAKEKVLTKTADSEKVSVSAETGDDSRVPEASVVPLPAVVNVSGVATVDQSSPPAMKRKKSFLKKSASSLKSIFGGKSKKDKRRSSAIEEGESTVSPSLVRKAESAASSNNSYTPTSSTATSTTKRSVSICEEPRTDALPTERPAVLKSALKKSSTRSASCNWDNQGLPNPNSVYMEKFSETSSVVSEGSVMSLPAGAHRLVRSKSSRSSSGSVKSESAGVMHHETKLRRRYSFASPRSGSLTHPGDYSPNGVNFEALARGSERQPSGRMESYLARRRALASEVSHGNKSHATTSAQSSNRVKSYIQRKKTFSEKTLGSNRIAQTDQPSVISSYDRYTARAAASETRGVTITRRNSVSERKLR